MTQLAHYYFKLFGKHLFIIRENKNYTQHNLKFCSPTWYHAQNMLFYVLLYHCKECSLLLPSNNANINPV